MKKTLIGLAIASAVAATGAHAQNAGGNNAQGFTLGGVNPAVIVGGTIGAGIGLGFVSNVTGSGPTRGGGTTPPVTPPPPPPPPSCDGDDELVDGVCVGTTVTVTVSGTGTVTVPVTFTYPAS